MENRDILAQLQMGLIIFEDLESKNYYFQKQCIKDNGSDDICNKMVCLENTEVVTQ